MRSANTRRKKTKTKKRTKQQQSPSVCKCNFTGAEVAFCVFVRVCMRVYENVIIFLLITAIVIWWWLTLQHIFPFDTAVCVCESWTEPRTFRSFNSYVYGLHFISNNWKEDEEFLQWKIAIRSLYYSHCCCFCSFCFSSISYTLLYISINSIYTECNGLAVNVCWFFPLSFSFDRSFCVGRTCMLKIMSCPSAIDAFFATVGTFRHWLRPVCAHTRTHKNTKYHLSCLPNKF